MRVLVVYESMYGNTRVVAGHIADGLRGGHIADGLRGGHDVIVAPVGEATAELVAWADLVIVGGPTHMHRLSTPSSRRMAAQAAAGQDNGLKLDPHAGGLGLRDWLDAVPASRVLAAAFDTRINARPVFTGRASRHIRKLLKQRGYHVIAAPESFLVTSRSALLGGEAARARRWGTALGVVASDVKHPVHA